MTTTYEASKAAISKTLAGIRLRTLEALAHPETSASEERMLSKMAALFAVARPDRPDALLEGGFSVGPTPEWEGLVELVLEMSISIHEETVASMLTAAADAAAEAESSSESPTGDPAAG